MSRNNWTVWLVGAIFAVGSFLGGQTAHGVLTTNNWNDSSSKWELGANWSAGVPSLGNAINFVTGGGLPEGPRTITIDAATVSSNAINNCMTISNVVVGGISLAPDTLFLNNANTAGNTALTILNTLTILSHGFLLITNSEVRCNGVSPNGANSTGVIFAVDGSVVLESGTFYVADDLITSYGSAAEAVGVNSFGTLTIEGGEDVVVYSGVAIGQNPGSVGTVWVTGGELDTWESDSISIGVSGTGSLIQSNGTIAFYGEFLGVNPGSRGTLRVAGGFHNVDIQSIGAGLGATGTVWVTGGILNLRQGTTIGEFGVGSLIQSNGTVYTAGESLGESGGEGQLVIAGGTNDLAGSGLYVGTFGGTGSVWLTGGEIQATSDQGYISIDSGSLTQSNGVLEAFSEDAGSSGDGTLTVAGGIQVVGFGGLRAGENGGSTGTVWVTGGQLFATSFSNIIGYDGVGSLVQSNGDMEMILSEYVGYNTGGDGTLTVAGGTHTVEDGELTVGNSAAATGAVWVTGGQLATDSAVIGFAGIGKMTVSNGNWLAQDVAVGAASGGNGTLTVAGATSVFSSGLTIGTPDCTGTGTVIVTGGSLFVTNAAHNAVLDVESGTLALSGGTLVVDVLVKTNPCASFTQTGGTLVVGEVTNTVTSFHITAISKESNNIRITWADAGGHTNIVQATNGTGGNYATNFTDLSAQIILPGSGSVTTNYLDVGGATNSPSRYYRVGLVP